MPRLFSGFKIPSSVAQDFAMFRSGIPGAKWVELEDYHITLCFIGDVDDRTADKVFREFGNLSSPALALSIEALSCFGGDKPRSIIATVRNTTDLVDLQADHAHVLRKLGISSATRKYTPHITLARLKRVTPIAIADYLEGRSFSSPPKFDAHAFEVFSARDSVGGGPYLIEASYPLVQSKG